MTAFTIEEKLSSKITMSEASLATVSERERVREREREREIGRERECVREREREVV